MSDIAYPSQPHAPAAPAAYQVVERRPAPIWEQVIVGFWFLSTFIVFPGNELILYPLALYFTGMIVLRRREIVPIILQAWPLLPLGLLTALSMFWSPAANTALRLGVMMLLTVAIAIYIAVRLTPRQIIQAMFAVGALLIVVHVPFVGDYQAAGIFAEKNIFANRVTIAMIAALAVAYDRDNHWLLRLMGFPIAALGFILVLSAESATNLVFSLGAIVLLSGVWLVWSRFGAIRHLRSLIMILIAVAGVLIAIYMLNAPRNGILAAILDSLGKDTTLTGRTMLWDAAARVSAENPWFGVGAGGFWQFHVGEAQTLLELFYKPFGTQFSFHNSYLEVQVHLGYSGLALLILVVVWAAWHNLIGWFSNQNMARSFFLLIAGIAVTASFTESYLFSAFDTLVMLLYMGAISTFVRPQTITAPTTPIP